MKYIHFKMTNPEDYIGSLDHPLKAHLELISVSPCELENGKITKFLVILKYNNTSDSSTTD